MSESIQEHTNQEIKLEESADKLQSSSDAPLLKLKLKVKQSISDSLQSSEDGIEPPGDSSSNGKESVTSLVKKDIPLVIYNSQNGNGSKGSPTSSDTNSPTISSPHLGQQSPVPKLKIRIKSANLKIPTLPRDKKATEQVLDGSEPYCVCRSSRTDGFMICCDICELWCHGDCVGIFSEQDAVDIDEFHCPKCEPTYGSSKRSKQRKSHRKRKATTYNEDSILLPEERPIKAYGSFEELLRKTPFCTDNPIKKVNGKDFNFEFIEKWGFRYPILLANKVYFLMLEAYQNKDDLDIIVPPSDFTVNDVVDYVGKGRILDVIDVSTQSEVVNPPYSLGDWVKYFNSPTKDKILNVISLEVTKTKLESLVQGPKMVRDVDWIDQLWPKDSATWPKVQRYCLMSVAGSYTDFHIDFGGSSVWYHLISGQKLFLFIEPSEKNLQIYKEWASSPQQGEVFLAEKVDKCYLWLVEPGQTLFIPTGWIHAVYTPVDSLVFGGNFLHGYHIKLQLDIYDIELQTGVPAKFRFPLYEEMMWYAALHYANYLKQETNKSLCNYEYEGVLSLIAKLYSWLPSEEHVARIPKVVQDAKALLEELSGLILKQNEQPPMPQDEVSWDEIVEENKKLENPIPVTAIIDRVLASHRGAAEYKKQQNLKFYAKLKKDYGLDLLNPKFKRHRSDLGLDYLEEVEEIAPPQAEVSERAERLRKRKLDAMKKRKPRQNTDVVDDNDDLEEEYSDHGSLSERSASESESEGEISESEDILDSEPEARSTSSEEEGAPKPPRKARLSPKPKRTRNKSREPSKVKEPEFEPIQEDEPHPLKSQPSQAPKPAPVAPKKTATSSKAPPPASARERLAKKLGMKFRK